MKSNKKLNKKQLDEQEQYKKAQNEIVVGVKQIPNQSHKNNEYAKKNKQIKEKNTKQKLVRKNKQKKEPTKIEKIPTEKNKRASVFIKWVLIITCFVALTLILLLSPLFNIMEIKVEDNSKLSSEEIIILSDINIGDNLFKINKSKVENKLKQNPYVESVKLKRELPSVLTIVVNERKATFMLEMTDGQFALINNQGYILEFISIPENLPKLISYSTENLKNEKRLNNTDLSKLEIVLKIMKIANANNIGNLITSINIENMNNIILNLESEKKTVYIGNGSDINTKMLYIKAVLQEEKENEGEIFMDGKTNKEGEFLFREKV